MFVIEIIYNLTLLVSISILASFIDSKWQRRTTSGKIIQGILFGITAIIGMMQPFVFAPGLIFDGRTVILSLCGLFFGPVSAIIAAILAGSYRFYLGGTGLFMGLSTIITSAFFGALFHFFIHKRKMVLTNTMLLLLGIVVHITMIALMFSLPSIHRLEIIKTLGFTIIIIYPFATLLIGKIIKHQEESKKLTLQLKESQDRYRLIIEKQTDLVVKIDIDGRFLFVSKSYCEAFGKSEQELIGQKFLPLVHEDDRLHTQQEMQKLYAPPHSCYIEQRALTVDGWRWFAWSDNAIVNSKGQIEAIIGVGRDITEKKKHGTLQDQIQKRLENAEKIAKLGSWEFDYTKQTLWWSKQMYVHFNFDPTTGTPENETYLNAIHPEDREIVQQSMSDIINQIEPKKSAYRTNPESGAIKYLMPTHYSEYNVKGELVRIFGTIQDITESILNQQALIESQNDLQTTLMSIGDGVISTNTNSIITSANPKAEKLLALPKEQLIGKPFHEVFNLLHPQSKMPMGSPIAKAIFENGSTSISSSAILVANNGNHCHISHNASPILDRSGIIKGAIIVFSDETEKYQSQVALATERNLLRNVIDALPFSLYIKDCQGRKMLINKTEVTYLGKPFSEIIGHTDSELYPDKYASHYNADDERVINHGETIIDRVETIPFALGGERWLSTTKIPWTDENGNILGLIGFGMDVTARIEDELKIRKLSEGIEQSPNAVIITNKEGLIEYVNPRFIEMTGYPAERVQGKKTRVLREKGDNNTRTEQIWHEISNRRKWKGEFLSKKKDGTNYWESISISAITDNENNISNYLLIIEDITERKNLIEDLTLAKKRAEESDKLKSAFLANMSHEIRTPMNGILGFAELLRESGLNDETRLRYLEVIDQSGYRMLNIINDIIDISKIEAGQLDIIPKKIHVNELLRQQYQFFKAETNKKGLNLTLRIGLDETKDILLADKTRLSQILSNLIKNAIKFTHNGSIDFGYTVKENQLEFYIHDTGIGVDTKLQSFIFERFNQGELMTTRHYEGAGLGLSISKALVEMMNGTIWVESNPGEGSTFFFTLPYQANIQT